MALGPVIKSLLTETVKELPDDFAMKSQSVVPMLMKKGVKAEELEYANITIPEGKVTKQQLVEAEANRQDVFKTKEVKPKYGWVNLDAGRDNPTYKEKVLQFSTKDQVVDSRYESSHFDDTANYLAHTRIYDDTFNGTPTRVLAEIQSDLHQAGRQQGYASESIPTADWNRMSELSEYYANAQEEEELFALATRYGWTGSDGSIDEWLVARGSTGIPKSPFEKSWLRKGIERELVDAVNEGRSQLAIPISGSVEQLQRGGGVQKWYETEVLNTAKKVAKQTNSDFEVFSTATKFEMPSYTEEMRAAVKAAYDEELEATDKRMWAYEAAVNTFSKRAETLAERQEAQFIVDSLLRGDTLEKAQKYMNELQDEQGVTYAIIKPKMVDAQVSASAKERELMTKAKAALDVNDIRGFDAASNERYEFLKSQGMSESDSVSDFVEDVLPGKTIPGKTANFSTTLYSSPAAAVVATYTAYKAGYGQEEVNAKLASQGYDEEEIAEINAKAEKAAQAEAAGYSQAEIMQYLEGKEVQAETVESKPTSPIDEPTEWNVGYWGATPKRSSYATIVQEGEISAKELVSSLKVVQPTMTSNLTAIQAYFGDQEALRRYETARDASQQKIIQIAKAKFGLDLVPQNDDVGATVWQAQTEQGLVGVDPGFWQDFRKASGEMLGAVSGGIAGYAAGASVTPPVLPVVGPLAKPIAGFAGSMVGAALGSAAGAELDYLVQAIKLEEDMSADVAAHKAMSAAEMSVLGDALILPVGYVGKLGWKGVLRAKDMIWQGNTEGAYQALKDTLFMSDDQIEEVVKGLEKFAPLEGTPKEKAIKAVALTEPGVQDLTKAASGVDPQAGRAVVHSINLRAEEALKAAADLTDEHSARTLVHDLQNYTMDVKERYAAVKAQATQSPGGKNLQWDFDALAINPILDTLESKITDPTVAERFVLQAKRIRNMSESRTFADLIELRQLTNDFLYNKRITKADDKELLRTVIRNIDDVIEDSAPMVVEDAGKWLDNWATVRKDYATMKRVEKTAMYRAIFDKSGQVKPVTPDTVVKALGKYIGALDGSFEEVMSKIPLEGRKKYEGAVVDALVKRYTTQTSTKATHFPLLADELKKVNLTTPQARAQKQAYLEMAEVFKNDVYLAQSAGKIQIPTFQSYLTADPVVRAKFEIASGMFNYLKTWVPGADQRNMALVRKAAKLLEDPLNAKASKEIADEFYTDPKMLQQINALQQAAAKAKANGQDPGAALVKLYGNGSVKKVSGEGEVTKIPMHRIATLEQAKEIADQSALTMDSKSLDKELVRRGFKAVVQGSDRVKVIK